MQQRAPGGHRVLPLRDPGATAGDGVPVAVGGYWTAAGKWKFAEAVRPPRRQRPPQLTRMVVRGMNLLLRIRLA